MTIRFRGRSRFTMHSLRAAREVSTLHAAVMTVEDVNTGTRQVSGLLIPYGEVGYTDAGPVVVPGPGRVELPPAELWGRIKLMDNHQQPPVAVGYATNLQDRDTGLRGEFHIVPTVDGDRVLAEMTPDDLGRRARDGFSVELVNLVLTDYAQDRTVGELVAGRLSAVAAVPVPAWDNAREDGLAASRTNTGRNTTTMLTEAQRARLNELLAMNADDRTDEQNTELAGLLELAGSSLPESDDEGTDEGQDEGTDEGDTNDANNGAGSGQALNAGRSRRTPARVPGNLPGSRRRTPRRDIRELYAAQARVLSGTSRPELEAALSDITSTANIWTAGTDYDGQLWSGLEYQRRYVPLMTPGELRSYKGTGWKWTTKPEVADYAGDKAAVPSNQPVTEEDNWSAARLAGAHDLDRKFFDFGDTEFIEAYYAAMRESYARQSDSKARAFLVALGLANSAGAAGTGMFRAAAVAAQAIDDATSGATPDWFLINGTDRLALLDITQNDIPAYLETFGVTPDKFKVAAGVPAGTVIAGIKQATKFRELSGVPIRVEAINVANGGIDGGVFGYYATQEIEDGGVASATFA